jgi:hypothetical protein
MVNTLIAGFPADGPQPPILAASDDHMIPPPAQRAMSERAGSTVAEVPPAIRATCPSPQRWPTSSPGRRPQTKFDRSKHRAPFGNLNLFPNGPGGHLPDIVPANHSESVTRAHPARREARV